MLVDKNVKDIYSGGSKILAVMHKGVALWGEFEDTARVKVATKNVKASIVVEGKEYNLNSYIYLRSKADFTFTVKTSAKKYSIVLNRKTIFTDEVGSLEGKTYTVRLDMNMVTNNMYIVNR